MGKIALEGMAFFAKHGYYDEEQILGNEFIVDVHVDTQMQSAARTDKLMATVNYENIYLIVKYEMSKPARLLEHIGFRIEKQVKAKAGGFVKKVNVIIRKSNPPLGGRVKYSIVETSGRIGLEGMEFFAPIGRTPEERRIANAFIADVYVRTDFKQASINDNLDDTLNYEAIFWATKTEVEQPAQILENVAYRIADNLKRKFNNLQNIEVHLSKKNPPIRGLIPEARIEVSFSHTQQCGKCKRPILCYRDENCWCNNYRVLPATQRMLDSLYRGDLCANCLSEYGEKMK